MTLCNMTVEAGARAALIAPDDTTRRYVEAHAPHLAGADLDLARAHWRTLYSDADARFEADHAFDAASLAPFVTCGTSPHQALPVGRTVLAPHAEPAALARISLRKATDSNCLPPCPPTPTLPRTPVIPHS